MDISKIVMLQQTRKIQRRRSGQFWITLPADFIKYLKWEKAEPLRIRLETRHEKLILMKEGGLKHVQKEKRKKGRK